MPYPTVVTDDAANADRVNQFRTYASQLPDPAQPQIDADVAAYNAHVAKLGDVTQPTTPSASPSPSAAVSTSAAAPSSTTTTGGSLRSRNLISNQFDYQTSGQLTAAEAASACGPTAALAFARYAGRNPTIGEALTIAKSYGWTPTLGMAGPNSEVSLLGQMGVTSQYNPGASAGAVAQEVQAGRPIILDTPNHYYAIDDYNPQTGQYHVGGSGLALRGGSEWMTWSQIAAHGNGVRGSITMRSDVPSATSGYEHPAASTVSQLLGGANVGQSDQSGTGPATTGMVPQAPAYSGLSSDGGVGGGAGSLGIQPAPPLRGSETGQPPSPNDDLKEFSAYASSLGDPGGLNATSPQASSSSTSPSLLAGSNTLGGSSSGDSGSPSGSGGLPDFGAIAQSALSSVGGFVSSMLPKPADQGFSLPSSTSMQPSDSIPLTSPKSFSMPPQPYNDMAGESGPASPQGPTQPSLVDQALGIVSKAATIPQQAVSAALMPDLSHPSETPQQRTQRYWNEHTDPKADTVTRLGQLLDYATSIEDTQVANVVKQNPNAGFIAPAFKAATNPLSYLGVSKPMLIAGGVGAAGNAGKTALEGGTPGDVGTAAVEGFNTGQLVGGLGEGAYALGKAAAPTVGKLAGAVAPDVKRLATEDIGAVRLPGRTRPPQIPTPPPPPPPASGPADKLIQMYTDTPERVPQSPGEIASKAGQAFVNAWTDRGVAWNRWQQQVEKTIGRPLNAGEMSAELNRLNPDMAARVMVQEGLQPAIQSVPKEDLPTLSAYLTAQHNVDVARSMGQKVQTEALKAPLASTEGEKRVRTLNAQIRSYERLKADAAAAGDGTGVTHYDGLLIQSRSDLAAANRLAMKQVTALDAARAAGAQAAGKTAEDMRQFSGGLNANESQQALTELQLHSTPAQWQAIQAASDKIDAYVGTLRQRMVDAGLWTPELAQELKTQYPHYNPTKILDYMQTPDGIPGGASISVRDQGLKKFTTEGTERLREDPLASLQRLAFQTEALAKRNEAFNAFVKTNELMHGPNHPLRVIRKVADDYTPINTESKIAGFVDGKKQTYVMPKDFADAIQQAPMSPIKGLPVFTAVYRALLTSKNVAFAAGQIPLDAYSYAVRESTRAGGPQNLPKILKELVSAYGDTYKGLLTQTYHGDTAAFLKGGGGFAGHFQVNPGEARQSVEALHRASPFEITSASDIRRIVKDVLTFSPVEAVGARAELAPRVASMRLAQQRGQNEVQAVINGRTVTMDFDQGGVWSKYVNQFIPFFNVGLQGLATPARTIRDNPRGALATFAGLLMAPTIGAEVWNNSDPQRAKDYADIPSYIKDRSIVLMIPGATATDAQGERHPQYVEIRAREFSPFVDATRAVMQKVLGTDTRAWQDLAGGAVNAASPVNTDSGLLGVAGSVSPPILSQAYDLGANKSSYTGATIATKGADQRASTLSKGITSGVNAASDATGLGLNIRPSQTEFLSRDVLGGPGQMARDVSNMASGQGGSGLPQDTPLVGQITKRFVGGSVGQRLQSAQDQRISDATRPILRDAGLYDITPVQDKINGLPLSNDEQALYQETANEAINRLLPRVAASPAYQRLGQADKAALLQTMMDDMRQMAADITLKQVDPKALRERVRQQMASEVAAGASR